MAGIVGEEREVGVAANDLEQVVEVVGDATREQANSLELLRFPQLLFESTLPVGRVALLGEVFVERIAHAA